MKYHLVKEHEKTFEIKHPDGSHFHVAKSGLGSSVIKKVKSMPIVGMYKGGISPSENDIEPVDSGSGPPNQVEQVPYDVSPVSEQTVEQPQSITQQPIDETQVPKKRVFGPSDQSVQRSPADSSDTMADFNKDASALEQGTLGAAKAQAQGLKDQSDIYANAQKQQQEFIQSSNARLSEIDAESKKTVQDIMDSKIDPNRVWNEAGTGNQIIAGIGILLSGLGAGMSGQQNMAMQVINNSIQRDMEAQKANLGKKESLLSYNLRKYGDMQTAQQHTLVNMASMVQGQILASAARSNSQAVMEQAKANVAKIDMDLIPTKQQLAMRSQIFGPEGQKVDPATKIRFLVPEKQQEQAFKELASAKNHQTQVGTILSAFDSANSENTVGNRALHVGFEPAAVARIQTSIMPYLKDAEGRINEQELQRTDKLIPMPGDSSAKIKEKRLGMIQFLKEKESYPILDAYGLKPPTLYNESGEKKVSESPMIGK